MSVELLGFVALAGWAAAAVLFLLLRDSLSQRDEMSSRLLGYGGRISRLAGDYTKLEGKAQELHESHLKQVQRLSAELDDANEKVARLEEVVEAFKSRDRLVCEQIKSARHEHWGALSRILFDHEVRKMDAEESEENSDTEG